MAKMIITPNAIETENGVIHLNDLEMKNVNVKLSLSDKQVLMKTFSMMLDQGKLAGTAQMNLANNAVMLNLTAHHLPIQPVLKAIYGYQKFYGILNGNVKLNYYNNNLNSLNGAGRIDFQNGQYRGLDLDYLYRLAVNTAKPGLLAPKPNTHMTSFVNMQMHFTIKHGIVMSKDLLMTSPVLRVMGKGSANLVNQKLNWELNMAGLNGRTENAKVIGPDIPFIVHGTFSHPRIRPDLKAFLHDTMKDQVEGQLKQGLKHLKLPRLF